MKTIICLLIIAVHAVFVAFGQTNQIKLTNAVITRVDGITATFNYPADWKLERQPTEPGNPSPRVGISSNDMPPKVIMSIHGRWEDATKAENLEFIDESLQELFKERANQYENKKIEIKSIEGDQVYGRFIVVTFKPTKEKFKPADDFKHFAVVKLISNNHYVFATIACNETSGKSFEQVLTIFKSLKVKARVK